jgi:hypothetical protein
MSTNDLEMSQGLGVMGGVNIFSTPWSHLSTKLFSGSSLCVSMDEGIPMVYGIRQVIKEVKRGRQRLPMIHPQDLEFKTVQREGHKKDGQCDNTVRRWERRGKEPPLEEFRNNQKLPIVNWNSETDGSFSGYPSRKGFATELSG